MNHHPAKKKGLGTVSHFWGFLASALRAPAQKTPKMQRLASGSYAASFSARNSFGLLFFRVRMGLLLFQIKCCASF